MVCLGGNRAPRDSRHAAFPYDGEDDNYIDADSEPIGDSDDFFDDSIDSE
jgi:hypothetical protein